MERDVIANAVQNKQRLLDEFHDGVVHQINELLWEVTDNIIGSLDNNDGKLTGSTSMQLHNLIQKLERMNHIITGEEAIDTYIQRLKSVLPASLPVVDSATKRKARLDTTRLSRVLTELRAEADEILTDLGHAPAPRSARTGAARPHLDIGDDGTEEESGLVLTVATRQRRSAGSPFDGPGEDGEAVQGATRRARGRAKPRKMT